jgi:hypothetical protein
MVVEHSELQIHALKLQKCAKAGALKLEQLSYNFIQLASAVASLHAL